MLTYLIQNLGFLSRKVQPQNAASSGGQVRLVIPQIQIKEQTWKAHDSSMMQKSAEQDERRITESPSSELIIYLICWYWTYEVFLVFKALCFPFRTRNCPSPKDKSTEDQIKMNIIPAKETNKQPTLFFLI